MTSQRMVMVLGLMALGYFAASVLTTFFLALFLAMFLEPWVRALTRRGLGRFGAATAVLGTFFLGSLGAGWLIYLSASSMLSEWPAYVERWTRFSAQSAQLAQLLEHAAESQGHWTTLIIGGMGSLYELMTVVFFVPLLLIYFLLDKENLVESFNGVAGRYWYLPKLNSELPKMVRAYFEGNILTAAFLIACHSAVFYSVGLDHWLSIAVISGVLNLLPIVGIPLALVLPLAQGALQFADIYPFLVMGAGLGVLHFTAANLILPATVGARINLNSVAMVVGLLFWGWLWGAIGFLLAIPMTALLKITLQSNASTYPLSNLLAAKPRHVVKARVGIQDGTIQKPGLRTARGVDDGTPSSESSNH